MTYLTVCLRVLLYFRIKFKMSTLILYLFHYLTVQIYTAFLIKNTVKCMYNILNTYE